MITEQQLYELKQVFELEWTNDREVVKEIIKRWQDLKRKNKGLLSEMARLRSDPAVKRVLSLESALKTAQEDLREYAEHCADPVAKKYRGWK